MDATKRSGNVKWWYIRFFGSSITTTTTVKKERRESPGEGERARMIKQRGLWADILGRVWNRQRCLLSGKSVTFVSVSFHNWNYIYIYLSIYYLLTSFISYINMSPVPVDTWYDINNGRFASVATTPSLSMSYKTLWMNNELHYASDVDDIDPGISAWYMDIFR